MIHTVHMLHVPMPVLKGGPLFVFCANHDLVSGKARQRRVELAGHRVTTEYARVTCGECIARMRSLRDELIAWEAA